MSGRAPLRLDQPGQPVRPESAAATKRSRGPTNRHWQATGVAPSLRAMLILLTFALGVGNFAMHKAVLESGHPMLAQMPWFEMFGGRLSLGIEFALLVGAMLLTVTGHPGWGLGYLGYTALNTLFGWLIVSRQV